MSNSKKILLVEGEADKSFFTQLCRELNLDNSVQVALPKEFGGSHNTKNGVINQLDTILPQLEDGTLTNIASVVDADYEQHGSGLDKTLDLVSNIVSKFDFNLKSNAPQDSGKGFYFEHADGLSDLGLWVMPDNKTEGMLEDWIKSCICEEEVELFSYASSVIPSLPTRKFKSHLTTKAEVATWLAWQQPPGHGLYLAITNDLLNKESEPYSELCNWLTNIFK